MRFLTGVALSLLERLRARPVLSQQAGVRVIISFTPASERTSSGPGEQRGLAEYWGQPVVVPENRAGAGGSIGSAVVAKAAPDGYTLLINSNAHLVNPAIYANLPYDTVKDFTDIVPLSMAPNVLVVNVGLLQQVPDGSRQPRQVEAGRNQLRPRWASVAARI